MKSCGAAERVKLCLWFLGDTSVTNCRPFWVFVTLDITTVTLYWNEPEANALQIYKLGQRILTLLSIGDGRDGTNEDYESDVQRVHVYPMDN